MRLLIITQKVDFNDPILGFFHKWIEEFAKNFEHVSVICLEKGEFDLPANVSVYSLGKEKGGGRLKYIFKFFNLLIFKSLNYDLVFVHMNPIYIVLAGWWWRLTHKGVYLWYNHRQVDFKLKVAEFFVDKIFTVSEQIFRLPSKKIKAVGFGISLDHFQKSENYQKLSDKFRIVSVGRIAQIKNLHVLIEATFLLLNEIPNLEVSLVGEATNEDESRYFEKLKRIVSEKKLEKVVHFVGAVNQNDLREYYWQSDLSVNLAPTGGVDKAVLESMAAGLPVVACNESFKDYFGQFNDSLLFKEGDAEDLAKKIKELMEREDKKEITDFLYSSVREKASLEALIGRITKEIK